jgi:hypothetical protein
MIELIQEIADNWNRSVADTQGDPMLRVTFKHWVDLTHPDSRLTDYIYSAGIFYEQSNAPLIKVSFQYAYATNKPAEEYWKLVYTALIKQMAKCGISGQLEFHKNRKIQQV